MKIQKIFTIDEEIIGKLKEIDNKSALVNKLLEEYFKAHSIKTEEELEHRLAEIELEEEYDSKRKELDGKRIN